ncbi:hypothetical protein Val02_35060 [Virgisporangium aliadipatigenens]|uniref:DUF397 domain-containing protein n=1 Tax=Virgisporangium aliadipatigenens TaxID=741659 RepID=A0A8J3YMK1_9ACTN|nr:DUF397 domain-containing protein [Virgisporangium aliadipatigenens]GIJ46620.1 hypothetical protein Val02_35060 [Virgisporangium aliadipatigenens]
MHDNGEPGWHTSTFSGTSGCVEVGRIGAEILVRDSKNPDDGQLRIGLSAWRTFIGAIRSGEFDQRDGASSTGRASPCATLHG